MKDNSDEVEKLKKKIRKMNDLIVARERSILSINEKGEFDSKYKNYVQKVLKSLYPIKKIRTWKDMKENYLDVFKLYYLRRFI